MSTLFWVVLLLYFLSACMFGGSDETTVQDHEPQRETTIETINKLIIENKYKKAKKEIFTYLSDVEPEIKNLLEFTLLKIKTSEIKQKKKSTALKESQDRHKVKTTLNHPKSQEHQNLPTPQLNLATPKIKPIKNNSQSLSSPKEISKIYFVISRRLNVRRAPNLNASIVRRLNMRDQLNVYEIKNGWARISKKIPTPLGNSPNQYSQWVYAKNISQTRPKKQPVQSSLKKQINTPPTSSRTNLYYVNVPRKRTKTKRYKKKTVKIKATSRARIRGAYVGSCDCPYDVMRNGRRCGGRSAYSRPGGREPRCYTTD